VGTPPSPGKQDDWSLVSSPANTGLTAPPPGATTFTPDVSGTYLFTGKPGKGNGADASQRTLAVQVEPAEQLVCVNTRVWSGPSTNPPGMKVGSHEFPGDPKANLQVVVLERATAAQPNDGTPVNSTFSDPSAFSNFLSKLDYSKLVLVSGVVSRDDMTTVWGALERLGAVDVTVPDAGLRFSFIGIPGISKGSAWQTTDPTDEHRTTPSCGGAPLAADPATNLSGWLTLDTTGVSYTYVSPDFVDFDTDASAPSGEHAIKVGNQTYTAAIDSSFHFSHFHVLLLDRRRMCAEATSATECNTGPALVNRTYEVDCPIGTDLGAMNDALSPWSNNPDVLLFLALVPGTETCPVDQNHDDLINTLRAFGASPTAPGRTWGVDPMGRYALVGGGMNGGLPDGTAKPIVAESFVLPDFQGGPQSAYGTGHIAGTLVRDHQNRLGPREASLTGDQLDMLDEVAYGPLSASPEANDSAETAAFGYLSQQLGWPVTDESPNGIRDAYPTWDQPSKVPPDPETRIQAAWCTTARPPAIDAAACASVRNRLVTEFENVRYVDQFLADLKAAFVEDLTTNQSIISVVQDEIKKTLTPPTAKTALSLTVLHYVLEVASAIPDIGVAFKVAGGVLDGIEALSTDPAGGSADPMQAVYDTGDALFIATDKAFSSALAHIDAYQPLIVTDAAKLQLVGQRANSDKPNSPWNFSDTDIAKARTGLTSALKKWLYPPLVDAGFPVWMITIPSSEGFNPADRTPVTYRCETGFETTHPFGAEPADGWIRLSNGSRDFYLALGGTRYLPDDLEISGHHAPVPDADLLAQMFGPLPDGVGLNRTWYFEHYFERQLDTGSPLSIDCP
jgi:hypothetical protein